LITELLEGGTLYKYIKSFYSTNLIPEEKVKIIMKVKIGVLFIRSF